MATVQRRAERGRRTSEIAVATVGREIRIARTSAGLSIADAGHAVGISRSTYGRIERGELADVSVRQLSTAAAAVGLELSVRVYPHGDPIRDAAHASLLHRMHRILPLGAPWRTEVTLPIHGDLRAWDAMTNLARVRIAFEAETRLGDLQALARRLAAKMRDGDAQIVILVVSDTRNNRDVLRTHRSLLREAFPLDTREVLTALRAGRPPGASGIVVL